MNLVPYGASKKALHVCFILSVNKEQQPKKYILQTLRDALV